MSTGIGILNKHIQASTESELEQKLFKLQIQIGQKVEVISIYPRGSFVHAWIVIDQKFLGVLSNDKKEPTLKKKVVRKKRIKKA